MKSFPQAAMHGLVPFSSMARTALRRFTRAVLVITVIVLAGKSWEIRAAEPPDAAALTVGGARSQP
jgi:hypothetical protein